MGSTRGWSWLFRPYQWASGAVCASPVEAFGFDAAAVRSLCAATELTVVMPKVPDEWP